MSYAIDRSKVSTDRRVGLRAGRQPDRHRHARRSPAGSTPRPLAKFGNAYDPAKAKQLLASAGFKLGSDGIMANAKGQKLSFSVINIGDYSDWVASMQVVAQDLKAVGIQLTPDNLSNTDFDADLFYGKYQLAYYDQQTFGPSPYYELRNWLDSASSAPIGKPAATNYERYSNPATDALFDSVRGLDQHVAAALDHQPGGAGHAERRAGHPGRPGGGLVPVRHHGPHRLAHPEQPLRPAVRVRLPRLWSRSCCTSRTK